MKKRLSLFLVITVIIMCHSSVSLLAESQMKYIYNPSYHGALLFNREQCIIGILMNGLQIDSEMLNTGLSDIEDKVCIKLPGNAAYAWIEKNNIVDEPPESSNLLIGITDYIMDSGELYSSPTDLREFTDKRLENGERVVIGGRYLQSYYLPEKDPHWISADELIKKVNNESAKYRIYYPDLLSYTELAGMSGVPDGSERYNETTAIERAREILEQEYEIDGLGQLPSKCGLNVSHSYSSVGKTWFFSFGNYEEEQYYEGELVDGSGELYRLQYGEYGDNYLIYEGFPCE